MGGSLIPLSLDDINSCSLYGFFAHRNPVRPWSVGEITLRFAERKARALPFQAPPRITLVPPDDGPVGFFDGAFL